MWSLIYSQTFSSANGSIPSITLSLTAERIAILVSSSAAKPTWNLGLELKQIASYSDFSNGFGLAWYQKIYLNQNTVIDFPVVATPYTLKLEIPLWFTQISIQIWDASQDLSPLTAAGFLNYFAGSAPSSGYTLRFDGYWVSLTLDSFRTIGNPSSGAHLAYSWLKTLFSHLWNSYGIDRCPLLTSTGGGSSKGSSATADWDANKRLTLPDYRDSVLMGAGSGRLQASIVGANTNTLTLAQLPAHSHPGSSTDTVGSHAHTGSSDYQGYHAHNLTINAAGAHTHSIGIAQTAASGTARIHPSYSPTTTFTSDSQGSHAHSGSVDAQGSHAHTFTSDSQGSHSHTVTIASQGSGQAFSTIQKSAVEHIFISAGAR